MVSSRYKVGDQVILYGVSWNDDDKIRLRGTIVGYEILGKGQAEGLKKKTLFFKVKPLSEDVEKLYDADLEEYRIMLRDPMKTYVPHNQIKPIGAEKINSFGYY